MPYSKSDLVFVCTVSLCTSIVGKNKNEYFCIFPVNGFGWVYTALVLFLSFLYTDSNGALKKCLCVNQKFEDRTGNGIVIAGYSTATSVLFLYLSSSCF